jgi:hypothetical protein
MAEELYGDRFGRLRHDETTGVLELEWLDGSGQMNDDDFMGWLTRYAEAEEAVRAPNLLIGVRRFGFRPGAHVAAWRDENIIPRYNAAGVTRFAFLLPAAASGTVGAGNAPALEPPGTFPVGYFDSREQLDAWFAGRLAT